MPLVATCMSRPFSMAPQDCFLDMSHLPGMHKKVWKKKSALNNSI